ncbi:hypothetical protein HK104_005062, partial [Borealophlyctis nickersoniae]
YYPNCANRFCTFYHPDAETEETSNGTADMSKIPCKYEPFCERPGCKYQHASKEEPKRSAKFTSSSDDSAASLSLENRRKHVSERVYAVADEDTEKLPVPAADKVAAP